MYYSYLNTDQKFINSTLIRSKSELLIITNVILTRLKIKNMYYKKKPKRPNVLLLFYQSQDILVIKEHNTDTRKCMYKCLNIYIYTNYKNVSYHCRKIT